MDNSPLQETNPRQDAITGSRIRAISPAPNTTPNKVYTFQPQVPVLLCLRQAVERYSKEEGFPPSKLRLSPRSYQIVAKDLGPSPDRTDSNEFLHYCLYLDRDALIHLPVDAYHMLGEHQVECVGFRKTGPILAVTAVAEQEIA